MDTTGGLGLLADQALTLIDRIRYELISCPLSYASQFDPN